jgi:hypothetical protein
VQRDVEWRRTLLELCLDMLQTSRPRPGQTMVIVQRRPDRGRVRGRHPMIKGRTQGEGTWSRVGA